LRISIAKNYDFDKFFFINRLKNAVIGYFRLFLAAVFYLKSHDSCIFGDSEHLKIKNIKFDEPKIHQSNPTLKWSGAGEKLNRGFQGSL